MATVKNNLSQAWTVADLIDALQGYPEDAKVVLTCDYGDHCHTQQALPVDAAELVNSNDLHESGYSQSGIALNSYDSDNLDGDDNPEDVVVLNFPN